MVSLVDFAARPARYRPGPQRHSNGDRRVLVAPRLRCVRVSVAAEAQTYVRDPELQAALDDLFADTVKQGRKRVPREAIQGHIDRIAELGRRLDLNRVHPAWNDGKFQELITTNTTGVSEDSVCSLQRLTFGLVRPGDLPVQLLAGNQIKGPLSGLGGSSANGYALRNQFRILKNGVLGLMTVEASYDTDGNEPSRLGVTFNAFNISPASPDPESLALWREALGEANPGMDEQGVIAIAFPKPPRAALNYILMEPDLQLSLGGSGDFLAVQRLQE
ncbi:hypothetical protein PLESTB_001088400 [Pleodorina starrii]|uniref:Uncharacterized protein n=1 Tax=Pleodorina starrii TaxID=330485 RepID=A0A9W6BRA0_9CHLO|nr:hypothetical protein PLESTM_000697900 [Pleodorina starrii]GLC56287.1 hypothetical protein PLESTB_001088400 [Pleodorina starrii]